MTEDAELDAIVALADPVRRSVYRAVIAEGRELSRDEVAEAANLSRSLAAFHLDKLVEAGLLATAYRRKDGRSGPGAGRPTKWYRRSEAEHAVTLPPRSYVDAATILADVIEKAGLDEAVYEQAHAAGAKSTVDGSIRDALEERGYEPFTEGGGTLRLRNCPFHQLARDFPPLVCGMNLALLSGLLSAHPDGENWTARMDPRPDGCCVSLSKDNRD